MSLERAEDVVLRERLALERTRLANERTFLAYVRTTLTLWAATAALTELFSGIRWSAPLAALLLVAGGATLGAGIFRFFKIERRLKRLAAGVSDAPSA